MHKIQIKRVYAEPGDSDGIRILVDRLWPRGIKKKDAKIDLWIKEIAPSGELRKFFNHDPEKWPVFKKRYLNELNHNNDCIEKIKHELKHSNITLLFAAKDEIHNNAIVLADYLSR